MEAPLLAVLHQFPCSGEGLCVAVPGDVSFQNTKDVFPATSACERVTEVRFPSVYLLK